MKYYSFPCGCKFPVLEGEVDGREIVQFDPHLSKIPLDCERTWDLISSGNTKGVFQLESNLGQSTAKRLKPRNMEHLSALVAIIRPGASDAVRGKKNITNHYIDRKNGEEAVEFFHPALEPALKPTYGEMIYQEQAMRLAQDVAGFDLQQADVLRKAIGKKKVELMQEVKEQFLEGAKKEGIVNEEQAEEIFGWIEKSQRYSFNKSHSVSYAYNSYLSAYTKAHFIKAFFTSWLYYSVGKPKPQLEINELANNAKGMEIEVWLPDIRCLNKKFRIIKQEIRFGLIDIKNVGESSMKRVQKMVASTSERLKKPIEKFSWIEFLVFIFPHVNSATVKSLISAGALSYMDGMWRTRMLYEYDTYMKLTDKEKKWCENYLISSGVWDSEKGFQSLSITLEAILEAIYEAPTGKNGGCSSKPRQKKVGDILSDLKHPPYRLEDTAEWISNIEEDLLGLSITCSVVDSCDIEAANCTCKEFIKGQYRKDVILIAVTVDKVNEIRTKKGENPGQKMAFITGSDITGSIDSIVAFPDSWVACKRLLAEGNTVMVVGEPGKQAGSLVLKKVYQI